MACPSCGFEHGAAAKFCEACGARLPRRCPACGEAVGDAARFCASCGQALTDTRQAAPTPARSGVTSARPGPPTPDQYTPRHLTERILAARESLIGERKQVTVLFADVVGSTELIRDRDPEEAQQLLDGVVQRMMDAVHRYEGTVSRLMGDGLMAMFGAPIAHEDHAVRACYAALALLDGARRHAEQVRRTHGITIAVRVGVSSGEVVVRTIRDDLHMDYTAMGQTVHLASRLEGLAEPGTAVLSAETVALAEGYVQVRALGPVPVKGLDQPIEVYGLIGAGQARTRLQASAARGLTRFVGRDGEMAALYRALEQAQAGHGQLAALVGEPGVGKSRLVWEVTHSHRAQDWLVLESGSVSYGKATSYLPVIDLLKAYCRIEAADDARAIREKVTGKLLTLDRALEPCLPALLALLDVPADEDGAWQALDPVQRRRQTLDAVQRLLLRESQEQPLLLVFEDLHWIDSETQALLDSLVERLPAASILLLVNYRPEYSHTWGSKTYYSQLRIDPLGEASADKLLASLLGDDPSVEPLTGLLTARTEGNPLFLEESVRTLVETGMLVGERGAYRLASPVTSLRVPATVQAVLAARIDRLPASEKALLQTAAVIGKDVPDALLRAIADRSDDDLQLGLAHLQTAEFVYQARLFPELEYTFKHALTHEVAYGSLLQERKKTLHARVVTAIESTYPDRLDEHIEVLAHHALRAELWSEAVRYARAAGNRGIERWALKDATNWFEGASRALKSLPESRDTQEQTIDLTFEFRRALQPLGAERKLLGLLLEAEGLAHSLGDRFRLGRVCGFLVNTRRQLGEYDEAIDAAKRALMIADELHDVSLRVTTTLYLGILHLERCDFREAADCARSVIETVRASSDHALAVTSSEQRAMSGQVVVAHHNLARALSFLGEVEGALTNGAIAVELADLRQDRFQTATALSVLADIHLRRGDAHEALTAAERALSVAQAGNFLNAHAWANANRGAALIASGDVMDGIRLLEDVLAMAEAHGRLQGQAQWAIWLAEGYRRTGRRSLAESTILNALAHADVQREPGYRALALCVQGEIGSESDLAEGQEAESRYCEALVLAEELGMRPLQAHCHLGLGKLYGKVGRRDQAQAELRTAIAMFREMGMIFWLPDAEQELAQAAG